MMKTLLLLLAAFPTFAYTVGGSISGFVAPSTSYLVLVLNNKTYRIIPANATSYRFNTTIPNGMPYLLRVGIQPANMNCSIVNMDVTCVSLTSAVVYWTRPTMNTDGTPLTDLTGYVLYYGTDPTLTKYTSRLLSESSLTTTISNLIPGNTYFFSIASVSASGGLGSRSNFASVTK